MSLVLLTEPDPVLRRLLHNWLTGLGHVTAMSARGDDLAAACRAEGADLLLIGLGGDAGADLAAAEALRRESAVEIVLTSGSWSETCLARAQAIGASVLQKPFTRTELAVALTRETALPDRDDEDAPTRIDHSQR